MKSVAGHFANCVLMAAALGSPDENLLHRDLELRFEENAAEPPKRVPFAKVFSIPGSPLTGVCHSKPVRSLAFALSAESGGVSGGFS